MFHTMRRTPITCHQAQEDKWWSHRLNSALSRLSPVWSNIKWNVSTVFHHDVFSTTAVTPSASLCQLLLSSTQLESFASSMRMYFYYAVRVKQLGRWKSRWEREKRRVRALTHSQSNYSPAASHDLFLGVYIEPHATAVLHRTMPTMSLLSLDQNDCSTSYLYRDFQ